MLRHLDYDAMLVPPRVVAAANAIATNAKAGKHGYLAAFQGTQVGKGFIRTAAKEVGNLERSSVHRQKAQSRQDCLQKLVSFGDDVDLATHIGQLHEHTDAGNSLATSLVASGATVVDMKGVVSLSSYET